MPEQSQSQGLPEDIRDRSWHSLSADEVVEQLQADPESGLGQDEAERRRERFGKNRLPEEKKANLLQVLLQQFRDPLIYILLVAGAVSLAIQHWNDAIFIFAVLALNATIGTIQEWKAQLSAEGLKKVIEEKTDVTRDGRRRELPSESLVPGDLIQVESGDRVPADTRLISSRNLRLDESLLTGESTPVEKDANAEVDEEAGVGDRLTMLHAGSNVLDGRGVGIVCRTGVDSELGRIAKSLAGEAGDPPLVIKMRRFTRHISVFVLVAVVLLGAGQIATGATWSETFLLAVALAVSAIPAGLPVAVTVALSVASHRMAKRNVIVRRLPAVEGLGSSTTIASDKTGTLTENKLTIKLIAFPEGESVRVQGEGYRAEGGLQGESEEEVADQAGEQARRIALSGALCNEAVFDPNDDGEAEYSGDTVDLAFLVLAAKLGIRQPELEEDWTEIEEIPFESQRRYGASFRRKDGETTAHVKGAAEKVVGMCKDVDAEAIEQAENDMAADGYRVLAVASGEIDESAEQADEDALRGLDFLGLVGLIDPVRKEVPDAVDLCHRAGVKVLMVTGDHPATALTIAKQLNIPSDGQEGLTGKELEELKDNKEKRSEKILATQVFARFEPTQKVTIVETLQDHGEFVAVTGDGVNDAPALKSAHISVAMGKGGTDVARRVAELILTDDNFASIANAIEEGRIAFDNVRKVVWLLISTGAAEVVLFFLALVTGMPLPLFAVQLLWLNLVTNGVQDVALAFEKKEPGIMDRPPRPPDQPIFDRRMIEQTTLSALVIGGVGFGVFYYLIRFAGMAEGEARNLLLLLMVLFENVHIFNCRSERRSAFRVPLRANYLLIATVALAQSIHIAAMYIPGLSGVLQVHPVSLAQWAILLALALSVIVVIEIYKWLHPERKCLPSD